MRDILGTLWITTKDIEVQNKNNGWDNVLEMIFYLL
jgi:hypothetical protein